MLSMVKLSGRRGRKHLALDPHLLLSHEPSGNRARRLALLGCLIKVVETYEGVHQISCPLLRRTTYLPEVVVHYSKDFHFYYGYLPRYLPKVPR